MGEQGKDPRSRRPNPDFVQLPAEYTGRHDPARARKNFGCGSSREHAPWELQQYGFKAVISALVRRHLLPATALKNGFCPWPHATLEVDHRFQRDAAHPGLQVDHRPRAQTVTTPSGIRFASTSTATRKHNLLNGLDEIGLTLQHADEIRAYRESAKKSEPWIFQ